MYGKITGVGSCIPECIITNEDLTRYVDTENSWIVERTGIEKRHVMQEESTSDMAVSAAKDALMNAGMDPEKIDLIIVSTTSSDRIIPNTACYVQQEIGAVNAFCLDMNVACTGFITAYNTAQTYMHAGLIQHALIIAAEGLSRIVNWQDRGTCILFGDGAGAVVLSKDPEAVFDTVMHADGKGGDSLTLRCPLADRPRLFDTEDTEPALPDSYYVGMDGQAVFRFATRSVADCISELLAKMGMTTSEIDLFLLHQANSRILSSIARRMKVSMDKVPMNVMSYGNTSSASIPILLCELVKAGKIQRGDKLIMSGFGGGLTWAATYLEY